MVKFCGKGSRSGALFFAMDNMISGTRKIKQSAMFHHVKVSHGKSFFMRR